MYSQPWSPTPSTTVDHARVAHREALAGEPAEERACPRWRRRARCCRRSRCPRRAKRGLLRRAHHDRAAGHALAGVVVGVALQRAASRRARARRRSSGRPSRGRATSIDALGQARRRRGGARSRPRAGRRPRGSCSRSAARRARCSPSSMAGCGRAAAGRRRSSRRAPASGARIARRGASAWHLGAPRSSGRRSMPRAFQWSTASSAREQVGAADQLLDACARRATPSVPRASSATMNR